MLHPLDMVSSKLIKRNAYHYSALLGKAICDFVLRRDVSSAHENITKAQTPHDMTWLYGRAFLHAYSGKLQDAAREYRKIFSGIHREHTAPLQSEEFIQIVLNEEPSRSELHYCLGQINFFVKQDFAQAQRDFETFLSRTPINKHSKQRNEAEKLIEECNKKLSASAPSQPELSL